MSSAEVDAYLATLDEPSRSTLSLLRDDILRILPGAEQGMSYGAPAFRLGGALVAGFSVAAKHLSYLPHSGTVLESLDPAVLEGYSWSKGALRFAQDAAPPRDILEALISARLAEIASRS